jgi:hypothetical protein
VPAPKGRLSQALTRPAHAQRSATARMICVIKGHGKTYQIPAPDAIFDDAPGIVDYKIIGHYTNHTEPALLIKPDLRNAGISRAYDKFPGADKPCLLYCISDKRLAQPSVSATGIHRDVQYLSDRLRNVQDVNTHAPAILHGQPAARPRKIGINPLLHRICLEKQLVWYRVIGRKVSNQNFVAKLVLQL